VGLLTLPGGAWYQWYDLTSEEVCVTWVPTAAPFPLDAAVKNVCLRVWNISRETLNVAPDTKTQGESPIFEKVIDVNDTTHPRNFRQKVHLELEDMKEFLVFGFEGTGPALGDQERKVRFGPIPLG
jgi:hypothetical protein